MRPQPVASVPEETVRVVKAAFPNGHPYLRLRDEFGVLFADEAFSELFSERGQPAEAPGRLALVTVLQFAEDLSDRQAADAVRSRLDWKYLLGLEVGDPGFHFSVLCEFRARLLKEGREALLFETLLTCFQERRLLKARGKQRTDATHVLAAVRGLNRLETVGESMRHALNVLAEVAPEWLLSHHEPAWAKRYGRRFEEYRLPQSASERKTWAEQIGADGVKLLFALQREVEGGTRWAWLRQVPAFQTLRKVWIQQFTWEATGSASAGAPDPEAGRWRWREEGELPPAAHLIKSCYDEGARYGKKGELGWVGYKVHLTESCDPETPPLITHVETTPAATPDAQALPEVHAGLKQRELLPSVHLVDSGYIDAELLVKSQQEYGVDLCGPPLPDSQWQAQQATGFAASDFVIDFPGQQATCPAGQRSVSWREGHDWAGNPIVCIGFSAPTCAACACRSRCTRSKKHGRRLTLRQEADHRALVAARQREKSEAFAREYAGRAGVEGSLSQGVRRCGLRWCRYVGLRKVHLEHLLIAAGLNLARVADWFSGSLRARTRTSAYLRLLARTAAPT